jgi:hypothetical protein
MIHHFRLVHNWRTALTPRPGVLPARDARIWIWAASDPCSPALAQLAYHPATRAIKKPDSKENLASEEGDEKLFVGL